MPLFYGRNIGIRTRDLFVPNEARYQAAPYSDGTPSRNRTYN